ncbi:MAG: hypothetical protein ACYC4J_09760 [Gemmatimonadaceae bacterium]
MSQFLQPDHSKGDANTIGGYQAVHDRPAAFEGPDGFSYSVEILTGDTGESGPGAVEGRAGACLFFVRWTRIGSSAPMGHVESDWLTVAPTEEEARAALAAWPLAEARRVLHELVAAHRGDGRPARKWWDAMNADAPAHHEDGP